MEWKMRREGAPSPLLFTLGADAPGNATSKFPQVSRLNPAGLSCCARGRWLAAPHRSSQLSRHLNNPKNPSQMMQSTKYKAQVSWTKQDCPALHNRVKFGPMRQAETEIENEGQKNGVVVETRIGLDMESCLLSNVMKCCHEWKQRGTTSWPASQSDRMDQPGTA